jgi:hypothetical protein
VNKGIHCNSQFVIQRVFIPQGIEIKYEANSSQNNAFGFERKSKQGGLLRL